MFSLRMIFSIFVLLSLLNPAVLALPETDASQATIDGLLSWVKLKLPDIKDESEDARQAVIRDAANLDVTLGHLDAALKAELKDPNDREMILSLAAVKYAEEGRIADADARIFMMNNALYKIDAHIGIAKAQFKKDERRVQQDFDNASELLFNVPNESDKFERRKTLALAELDTGYLPRALTTAGGVSGDEKKAEILAEILLHIKQIDEFKKVRSAIDFTQDKFVRDALLQKLASAQAKAGFIEEADANLLDLPAPQQVNAYLEIAWVAFGSKKENEVKNLLEKAEKALSAIQDDAPKSRAYGALASFQSKIGMSKQAESNFYKMKLYAMRLGRENIERAELLVILSFGQLDSGRLLDATMNFYEARNSLYEAKDADGKKAELFSSIASGIARLGHSSDAKEFFSTAEKLALQSANFERKLELFCKIASDEMDSKLKEDSHATLEKIVKEIHEFDDETSRPAYFQKVALIYLRFKELDRAVKLLDRVESPLKKGDLLKAILLESVKADQIQPSIQLAHSQAPLSVTMRGLLGVAFGILLKPAEKPA